MSPPDAHWYKTRNILVGPAARVNRNGGDGSGRAPGAAGGDRSRWCGGTAGVITALPDSLTRSGPVVTPENARAFHRPTPQRA
jgi:hypothetical protein